MTDTYNDKPLSQLLAAELDQCVARQDLRPVDTHNSGHSIEQHDRATIAANRSNSFRLDVPSYRDATSPN